MSCNPLNLEIRQSTIFQRLLVIADSADVPIDLTGYEFKSIGKLNYSESEAAFTFDFEIQDQTEFPGKVLWTLPSAETAPLEITENTIYIYDVLMIQPDTEPISIISGEIIVEPVITPA